MASGVYNFQNTARSRTACEQGATFRRRLTLLNPNKTPVNLTGYQARMQVRNAKSNSLIAQVTTENGQITISALTGQIEISIPATVTEALPAGIHVYDLELVSGADVTRLIEGKFQVTRNITT